MSISANKQKLSKFLEKTLKERDKYQSVTLKVSEFGLIQMTRKRSGKTLAQQLTNVCPRCNALGFVKSLCTMSFYILKQIKEEIIRKKLTGIITLSVSPEAFDYLVNKEFKSILSMEEKMKCKIVLEVDNKNIGAKFSIKNRRK